MHAIMLFLAILLGAAPIAQAEVSDDTVKALQEQIRQLTDTVEQLKDTVRVQHTHIAELEKATISQQASLETPNRLALDPATGLPPVFASYGAKSSANLSAFNPEIGLLADVVGEFSESSADGEGNDKFTAREVEIVFGHPIDPYSRLDVTIAVPELEAVELEEAYITHWGLPEVKTRVGRFLPKVGKAVGIHRDSLETVDEPLVVAKYLGTEGLSRTGLEFSGFLPLPWTAVTHELIGGVMEGGVSEGGTLFGESRRRPSLYARLKNFWEISDATNLELGTTYLTGSKDADAEFEVDAVGVDVTLAHFFTPTNKLKWQNEAYFQHRDEAFEVTTDESGAESTNKFDSQPVGFYSLLDYRLSPRFGIGGRFDYVEPVDVNPALLRQDGDTALSAYLTLYQSEFARWRLQYRHTDFAAGGDDNTVFLQGTVAIGVHKHQLQ